MIQYLKHKILYLIKFLGFVVYSNGHVKNWNGILTTTNSKIKIISNPNDNIVGGSIRTNGGWAEEEIIRLKKVISNLQNNKEPKNLLVVGAHIGSVF